MGQRGIFAGVLILMALVLGVILALGLFQWETSARADDARLHPSPTARPPAPTVTLTVPPPPPTELPTIVPTDTPAPALTDTATSSPAPPAPATRTAAPAAATPAAAASSGASPALAAAGARVFAANCNVCHPNSNTGMGPAVHGPAFAARYPDDGPLKQVIRSGGKAMPAFSTTTVSDADLSAIVAYVRSR